jgi:hypothetical protein
MLNMTLLVSLGQKLGRHTNVKLKRQRRRAGRIDITVRDDTDAIASIELAVMAWNYYARVFFGAISCAEQVHCTYIR